jgi:dipeptidyl aminopeptidase/acylaminoacyl peptidase
VVELSTGRTIWSKSYPQDGVTIVDIRPSRDGQYIAVVTHHLGGGPDSTVVFTGTGSVLAHVAGRIEAFSWDGSLAVQMADLSGPVSVIRWRDGTVIWTGPTGEGYEDAMPEPGGQRLALQLRDPAIPQTGGFPAVNVYVVSAEGTSLELLKDVM